MKKTLTIVMTMLAVTGAVLMSGCDKTTKSEPGVGERSGAALDPAAENTAEAAKKAAAKTKEATGKALEKAGEAVDKAGEKMQD